MSDPTRIVADADVLAADLLVGGEARAALDHVRRHSWLTLVASEQLLDDAEAAVATLAAERGAEGTPADDADADGSLAADWRERIERDCEVVEHPPEDHPGLAAAYRGDAAHLLTFEDSLASARAGLSLQPHADVSVRPPAAFDAVFDAAALYEARHDDPYPGPDRDPRS